MSNLLKENFINYVTVIGNPIFKICKWMMHYNIQGLKLFTKLEESN